MPERCSRRSSEVLSTPPLCVVLAFGSAALAGLPTLRRKGQSMTPSRVFVLVVIALLIIAFTLILNLTTRVEVTEVETVGMAMLPHPGDQAVVVPSTQPPTTTTARTRTAPTVRTASASRPKPLPVTDAGVWDRLAQCESHGNWSINTGNDYFGGLQMDMQFWRSYGGPGFASRPDLASREQQIVVAERARDSGRGYHPWPTCARRLGLI